VAKKCVAWKDVFNKLGINTWKAGEDVTVTQGTSSGKRLHVVWTNFHRDRTRCPIDFLRAGQPLVRILTVSRACSAVGKLEEGDESDDDDESSPGASSTPVLLGSEEQASNDDDADKA
jgi:hypothetical protein